MKTEPYNTSNRETAPQRRRRERNAIIAELACRGLSQRAIAELFGVNQSTVSRALPA